MHQFAFWRSEVKPRQLDQVSPIWKELNATFVTVLSWSWLIYTLSALVILVCAYFAYCERCRRSESVRRRRVIQRAQERNADQMPRTGITRFTGILS
ncbi:uncharacterized protein LOC108096205 isoform X2 [Drosophila ficusphila]|uniref:uncharacterized protein LOC108096205 isoform X2 n=1 Tax=Drosophila ficusphila TaxID=30025 RepID=UPI0007E6E9DE|nr:uncharacterized protein LOC108096205 isoform X2 [Drosophila ficusphila]